ncbi:MAG: TonB-dependent receptor [Bacteroidetes bacterium]|nr:TonB-dependent receptor [Bacteroidota bacterium]
MNLKYLFLYLLLFSPFYLFSQTRYTVSGYIKEKGSEELLIGASIAIPSLKTGTVSNNYGFYSITLPEGEYDLLVSYIGYKPKGFKIKLNQNLENNIWLEPGTALQEVVVSAEKQSTKLAEVTRMSVIEIPVQQIKDIPALLGEKDVLKVIQLLPGVQKGGEGNSGIYVRGGGPDQNLIILDDATVYNAFHLFGFFSLFNGDALKSVELTKGGFPARYGGRLSSVIDMSMKEGNKEEFHGEAGIGLIASRLLLEGPIVKGKSSFLISGRRTYLDVLAQPFMPANQKTRYYFYDLNAKANYEINSRNKIYVSGYFGRDKFFLKSKYADQEQQSGINWGNVTGTIRWNHQFAPKLFGNLSIIGSDYQFKLIDESLSNGQKFVLNYGSGIRDFGAKYDVDFRPSTSHSIKAGVNFIYHTFTPSALVVLDEFSGYNNTTKNKLFSWENAVYAEDDIKVGARLRLNPGLRLSHFSAQGKNYLRLEPRFSSSYNLKPDLAIKASYALMNQYIHLLSNTSIGLPTDLWVPTTNRTLPQQSWQLAAGVAKDFLDKGYSVSIEGYYKESANIISYKEGASFFDADPADVNSGNANSWEDKITSGKGWSYGAEFFLQKKIGKLSGWIGYTLSWTTLQFDELNFGKEFYARYDRRHDISVVGIYEIRKETPEHNGLKLSGTWVYGTGQAITLPVAEYSAPAHTPGRGGSFTFGNVYEYTDRNAYRMAPYHRMDIGLQVQRKFKRYERTWEFSVYNLYNRANPFFYYISQPPPNYDTPQLTQVSLFPIIPSISWNIKF